MTQLLVLLLALDNPSFEMGLDGWTVELGAHRANAGNESEVVVDQAAVRFTSNAATRRWRMVSQSAPCGSGQRVLFTVAGRSRGIRREGDQFRNANAIVIFMDAQGRRLGIAGSPLLWGDREWIDLHVHAISPPGTARIKVGFFSSMSGTAWFDNARLRIAPAKDDAFGREALMLHLERTYPHWSVKGREFGDGPLVDALKGLKDLHVWVQTPERRIYTATGSAAKREFDAALFKKEVTETVLPFHVFRMGDIAYVRLDNFTNKLQMRAVDAALDKVNDAKALVFDVRFNVGGDEQYGRRFASRFTDRALVRYAKSQVRDPSLPGRDGFFPGTWRSFKGRKKDKRPIVVLQGPHTTSSGEAFVLMMKALDTVTTIGLPTCGASGNPKPFPLTTDTQVWIPTWRALTPDDKLIEGAGVVPEVRVESDALAKALARLRQ